MAQLIECSDCGIVDDEDSMQHILNTGETFCGDCELVPTIGTSPAGYRVFQWIKRGA